VAAEPDPARLALALYDRLAVTEYFWADIAPEAGGLPFAGLLYGRGDFVKRMLFAVNPGRHSDPKPAIAGGVSGAMTGLSGFPPDWVDGLQPVAGSCLRTMAGIHPLDTADQLVAAFGEVRA